MMLKHNESQNTNIKRAWRFIDSGSCKPAQNMAIDEALLREYDSKSSLPVFRLYTWHSPAITVGKFQKIHRVLNLNKCLSNNIPLIRRITGGGIFYHHHELTYSLVCSRNHIQSLCDSIEQSYRRICDFLILFYNKMNITAQFAIDDMTVYPSQEQKSYNAGTLCYSRLEKYDIVIKGKKVGGNAQKRKRHIIFQHGSIPVKKSIAPLSSLLQYPSKYNFKKTGSVNDFNKYIHLDVLKELIINSFQDSFNVSLQKSELKKNELQASGYLEKNKYSSNRWNLYGEI